MKKDIPEIGDLTQGINDSDIILTHKLPEMLEKSSGLQDRTNGTSEKKTETDGETYPSFSLKGGGRLLDRISEKFGNLR